jgi:hypothetical protein
MNAIVAVILSIGAFLGSTSCYNKQVDRMQIGRPIVQIGTDAYRVLQAGVIKTAIEVLKTPEKIHEYIEYYMNRY